MGSIIDLLMAKLSQESPTLTISAAIVDDGETRPFREGIDRSEKMPSRLALYFKLNFNLFPCDCMKSYTHITTYIYQHVYSKENSFNDSNWFYTQIGKKNGL